MEKVWLKHYDPGVPETINPDEFSSIPQMLEACFKQYANSPCLTNYGEMLTFKQVDKLSDAFAGYLQTECGLQKGDRVAIMMPNVFQYPIALLGILKAGMVTVNVSPMYSVKEANYALSHSGAKVLLVLTNFAHLAEKAIPGSQVETVIVTGIGDLFRPLKGLIFNFVVRYVKFMVPRWSIPKTISFKHTIKSLYADKFKKPEIASEDIAFLQFSEGRTIGVPKCAMLTHRNIISNGLQVSVWHHAFLNNKKNVKISYSIVPFFKLTATTFYLLTVMRSGFENHLITNPRDISQVIKDMQVKPFSVIIAFRLLYNDLINNEEFFKTDFSSLKLAYAGGMTTPRALADKWQSLTNTHISATYALTEASPVVCINPIGLKSFSGYLGLPVPSTEVKICDENGNDVGTHKIGEIWIKGPQVMKGYWQQPEETKKVLTDDGWFKTSDYGFINENGYVRFIDRSEDVIRKEEGIVYPNEVEEILREIGGVSEAIVVGGRNHNKEVIIKAYILRSDNSLTIETLMTHCGGRINQFKIPDEFEFCEELPVSSTGFVLRNKLRQQAGLV